MYSEENEESSPKFGRGCLRFTLHKCYWERYEFFSSSSIYAKIEWFAKLFRFGHATSLGESKYSKPQMCWSGESMESL